MLFVCNARRSRCKWESELKQVQGQIENIYLLMLILFVLCCFINFGSSVKRERISTRLCVYLDRDQEVMMNLVLLKTLWWLCMNQITCNKEREKEIYSLLNRLLNDYLSIKTCPTMNDNKNFFENYPQAFEAYKTLWIIKQDSR